MVFSVPAAMAQHGTSEVLVLILLGLAVAAQEVQAQTEPQAQTEDQAQKEVQDQTEGVKTQQEFNDDAVADGRIVGGRETTTEDFPWQLYVEMEREDGTYVCGGSIISETWSMSAAHCFAAAKPDGEEGFIETAKKIYLYAGATDTWKVNSDSDVQINIFNEDDFGYHVFIHPEYKIGAIYNNDIALFKLKTPWTLNEKVSPIALAEADDFIVGKELTVSGWGKKCANCGTSNILLYVTGLDLISRDECTDAWVHTSSRITENMICHRTRDKNTCGGDSGGPVITGSGDSNGPPYVQIGIVSWGYKICEAYYPNVFVDVAKYRTWIDEITGSDSNTCEEDSSSKCAKWAADGKCSKGKIFVKCKYSCACGLDGNPPCEDTKSKCSKLAAKGKCSNGRIYRQCKASCACGLKK